VVHVKRRLSILVWILVLVLIAAHTALAQGAVTGTVTAVDKYGNAILDLITQTLLDSGFEFGDVISIEVPGATLEAPFVTAYSEVEVGRALVRGPGGEAAANVILAINMGSFAQTYGVEEGTLVVLSLAEKAGSLGIILPERVSSADTDEEFANFREVTAGSMGRGTFYRSSSPVNNELGRAACAGLLVEAAGIKTVINLADSREELESYFTQPDFASQYYRELYEQGQVIALGMGVNYRALEFQAKLKEGLEFLLANEGPFLIHCNEGKDRAGFAAALLEALVGATVQEIKEDYMLSYVNYYAIEYGSELYEKIAESNILATLGDLAGLPQGASLEEVDLRGAAEGYLASIGLSAEQIELLKAKLTTDTK